MYLKACLLLFLITFLAGKGLAKKDAVVSTWAATPLTIDGSQEEWTDGTLSFEKKVAVDYAFRNDAENLFILFVFKDPKYLSTINATGLTIWFNTEGKKKEKYGITFTKQQVSAENFIAIMERQRGALTEEEKNNIRANPRYFLHNTKITDKDKKSSSEAITATNTDTETGEAGQAVFRSSNVNKMLVYEFAIPLQKAEVQAPGIGTEPGKLIKVGFEWGGMTEAMKKARAERRRIPGTDAMRAGESADSWSRRSQGARQTSQARQTPKQYSFWVDVQLSKNQ